MHIEISFDVAVMVAFFLAVARLLPVAIRRSRSHIARMELTLSDQQAAALEKELSRIIDDDRYPFSSRIRTLREILHMMRPEPAPTPLSPRKHYEPPRASAKRRRQAVSAKVKAQPEKS